MAEVRRTKDGRPYIKDPETGKEKTYTRVTSYVSALEETFGLMGWQNRHVALGVALRPDLALNAVAHRDDKSVLGRVASEAMDFAGTTISSNIGTALHKFTEMHDLGQELPTYIPDPWGADVQAFITTTQVLNAEHIEKFLVCDELQTGGTADRLYRIPSLDGLVVGDTKTGSVDYGILKIVMQLAVYSRSKGYDPETGERIDLGINPDWGLLVHLPAGTGECVLTWLKLWKAWPAVLACRDVRELRRLDWDDLTVESDWEDFL